MENKSISLESAPIEEIRDYLNYLKSKALELFVHEGKKDIYEELYNLIFSDEISVKIHRRFPNFDYYDPDCSYEDDVLAFIDGFIEYADEKMKKRDSNFKDFSEWKQSKN